MNNTKSNFGKWGWAMIIYCAISYYMAAVLSTDTLNWYPSAFASLRGWGEGFVNLCNAMAGLGGWIGVAAAIIFSIMAAKKEAVLWQYLEMSSAVFSVLSLLQPKIWGYFLLSLYA